MKVKVGVSNHHIHLNEKDCMVLFGYTKLNIRNMLNQPGQYAAVEKVSIIGPKNRIDNLVVVGPLREYTQVEISKTDAWHIGIDPPIRDSGDLNDASMIKIIGPKGQLEKECCIIANRHIHVDEKILKEKQLTRNSVVSIEIKGEKGGIIKNVHLKETKDAYFELHLDTDDANAFLLKTGDIVEIKEG